MGPRLFNDEIDQLSFSSNQIRQLPLNFAAVNPSTAYDSISSFMDHESSDCKIPNTESTGQTKAPRFNQI